MNDPAAADALAAHERLLQSLLRGDALPGEPAQRRLIRTHISSLVLAGDCAYKLRRPLALPFLDFSTVARRHADCMDELRLNRRTAPALYLDVRPVLGTAEAPRLGDPSDPAPQAIDWLLRMRRFAPSDLLDAMAREGRLGAAHIDALAREVAAFHAALGPSPAHFGRAETVRRWLVEALDAIGAHPRAQAHRAEVTALRAGLLRDIDRLAPQIERRRTQGFVREGHGDLHLANIVLLDGVPRPFDAIEFNAELRHIDVMNDIAFSVMDLLRHGLPSLAWRFAGGYVEHSGDFDGLALLRFFAAGRALVRARVALMRADAAAERTSPAAGDAEDAAVEGEAASAFARDLALAEQLASARADAPRLLLVCGLSGSGKSSAALHLAQSLGGIRVRSDVERKRLHRLSPTDRPTPAQATSLYGPEATVRSYARLGELARGLLAASLDAVVDAAALRRGERDALRAIAAAAGARFVLVECLAPEAALPARLARRARDGTDPSDADAAVLALQRRVREPLGTEEGAVTLVNDGSLDQLQRRCESVAARLQREATA